MSTAVLVRLIIAPLRSNADKSRSGKSAEDYITAIGRREQEWIKRYATPRPPDDPIVTSVAQNSPAAHLALLDKYLAVAPHLLPTDADIVAPTLWHTDLHPGNIFVHQGRISSIIDWQGTWTGPLILQGRLPRLVRHRGELTLELPADYKALEPDEKTRVRADVASSIVHYLYEIETAKKNPRLTNVFRFPDGRVRCDPVIFAAGSWEDDSIFQFRETLIRVER